MKSIIRKFVIAGVLLAPVVAVVGCTEHHEVTISRETREGEVREQSPGDEMVVE